MKTPTKAESIAKLAQWCVENSSETFSAFFDWRMPYVEVVVYKDGHLNPYRGDPVTFVLDLEEHFAVRLKNGRGTQLLS